jgi:hypothetical protein
LGDIEISGAGQKRHDYFLLDITLISEDEIVVVDVHLAKCASWLHLIPNWATSTTERSLDEENTCSGIL